jgi:hypothetical protein
MPRRGRKIPTASLIAKLPADLHFSRERDYGDADAIAHACVERLHNVTGINGSERAVYNENFARSMGGKMPWRV